MNQSLIITYINEYNDRGSVSCNVKTRTIPVEQLQRGEVFDDVFDRKLEVISIDEQELIFKYRGKEFSLNKEWQILGTVYFSLPNDYVQETYRMTFHLAKRCQREKKPRCATLQNSPHFFEFTEYTYMLCKTTRDTLGGMS